MKIKPTVYFKVAIILIFSIVITIVIESLITFYNTKQAYITQVSSYTEETKNRVTKILSDPLWNYDLRFVDSVLTEEMNNPNIYSIFITNANETLITGFVRDKQWESIKLSEQAKKTELIPNPAMSFTTADIEKFGISIGRLTFVTSDRFLSVSIQEMFIKIVFRSLLLSVIILILTFFGLKFIILDHIKRLNKVVNEFTDNVFTSRAEIKSHDEIGRLGKNFNLMADSISNYSNALLNQLYTDSLTDLPNRNKLIRDLENTENPTLILLNVDSFQEINDFYGNNVGDFVLKETAKRLEAVLENKNTRIYRLVADEFAVLINKHKIEDESQIRDFIIKYVFEEINDKIFVYDNNEINITTTVGVAYETSEETNSSPGFTLLNNADMALKQAKKQRKHFIVFDQKMEITKQYEHNIKWSMKIKSALKESRIIPFFQPIVNNQTGEIEKFECLVRMLDSNGDVISPFYFLEVSQKARLYAQITKIMIRKVFTIAETTNKEFSINISILDILNEDTNSYIFTKLNEHRSIAHRIVFEILESEGIENYSQIITFIDNVKAMGCKVAIDDFGSGYSNFDHILRLNVDYIKIDASMIKNIDKDINCQIITRTIISFAKELGLKTVCEFVHSKSVYEKVNELGADYSQGYYLGEPNDSPDMFAYSGI